MARPWSVVERVETPAGPLELRMRGERDDGDFLIVVSGRVLMNSRAHRSEQALAREACARIGGRPRPRVLIGGLGMGFTLRAALDALPESARVTVVELEPLVVAWCRGVLADLTGSAVDDPRVEVVEDAVEHVIAHSARATDEAWDAILLDLFEGPSSGDHPERHPLYGRRALANARSALRPEGVLAVWSEGADPRFEKRLANAGFRVSHRRPGSGGLRHRVVIGERLENRS